MYIQAPYIATPITVIKGKAPRIKRAKRKDVPIEYCKKPVINLKKYLHKKPILLIKIIALIRKVIKYDY